MSARESAAQRGSGALTLIQGGAGTEQSATNETERAARKPQTFTCGGCDAVWKAQGAAHCAGCHRTFSGATLFDRHRSIAGEYGKCHDPAGLTTSDGSPVCEFRDGMWRFPEMTDEQKAARFGGAK